MASTGQVYTKERLEQIERQRNEGPLGTKFRIEPRTFEYFIDRSRKGEWLNQQETKILCDAARQAQTDVNTLTDRVRELQKKVNMRDAEIVTYLDMHDSILETWLLFCSAVKNKLLGRYAILRKMQRWYRGQI